MALLHVQTKYGEIQGVEEKGYTLFKGIPYAKPPVGELRFEAPQKPEAWDGCRKADCWPNRPIQRSQKDGFYGQEFYSEGEYYTEECSEDCLYLNIWTPADSVGEKLPVAVWIHGGAFTTGYSWEKEFDGKAWNEKGVILVTVDYRLGVFGFLAHPALSTEAENRVSGNYGILDQIAALKWIYENIASFGGNPENITVFGQSAGAASVQTLVSSPLTKGLISKAVIQSGGGYRESLCSDYMLQDAEKLGAKIAELAGCTTKEELKEVSAIRLLEALSSYEAQMAQDMMSGKMKPDSMLSMSPVVDQYVLNDGYDASIEKGLLPDIPYMIGSNSDDIDKQLYALTKKGTFDEKGGMLYHGAVNFATKLEEMNSKPIYVYRFSHSLPGDDAGAFHSAELWYMFGTYERCWRPMTDIDAKLSQEMVSYWTNFVKNGNPNEERLSEWRACTKKDIFVKEFN